MNIWETVLCTMVNHFLVLSHNPHIDNWYCLLLWYTTNFAEFLFFFPLKGFFYLPLQKTARGQEICFNHFRFFSVFSNFVKLNFPLNSICSPQPPFWHPSTVIYSQQWCKAALAAARQKGGGRTQKNWGFGLTLLKPVDYLNSAFVA